MNQRIDELIEEIFRGSFMHNGYAKQRTCNRVCWQGTFDELEALDRGAFMREMKTQAREIFELPSGSSEYKSWRDSLRVMKYHVFEKIEPRLQTYWGKLPLLFEVLFPKRKKEHFQKRADVLICASNMIVVVEFKRRKHPYDGFLNQVVGYCRRVRAWTEFCGGRTVKGVLCYTEMESCLECISVKQLGKPKEMIRMCSQDRLKEALMGLLGNAPSAGDASV